MLGEVHEENGKILGAITVEVLYSKVHIRGTKGTLDGAPNVTKVGNPLIMKKVDIVALIDTPSYTLRTILPSSYDVLPSSSGVGHVVLVLMG